MYIVKIYTDDATLYFSGIYMCRVYTSEETTSKTEATGLSAEQADEVGNYYLKHCTRLDVVEFQLERI